MWTAKISRSSKTYIKSRYVFCSEERLKKLDSLQPPVSLHEEMFLRRWQAPRAIRIGPETLAGAEPYSGRLSVYREYNEAAHRKQLLCLLCPQKFAPQFTPKRHVREFHCLSHKPSLNVNQRIHIKGDKSQFDRRRSKRYLRSPCTILVNQKVNHEEHPLHLELVRTIKDLPKSITHSVRKVDQTNTTGTLLNSIQSPERGINFKVQLLQYQQAQKEEFGAAFQRTCL